jgi:hypothetical protein
MTVPWIASDPEEGGATTRPLWPKRRTKRSQIVAFVVAAMVALGAPSAALAAYWDYSNYLSPGHSYGEGQSGSSGYWYIRISQGTYRGMDPWLRYRGTSTWINIGCGSSDCTTQYPLSDYNASSCENDGSSTSWVNVRIDGAV